MILSKRDHDIYTAATLDCEGSISLLRQPSVHYTSGFYYRQKIAVSNTRKALLEGLRAVYGGSIQGPFQPRNNNAKPVWNWTIQHRKARTLLERVIPFLRLKRRQAEILLEAASFAYKKDVVSKNRLKELWWEARVLNNQGCRVPRTRR